MALFDKLKDQVSNVDLKIVKDKVVNAKDTVVSTIAPKDKEVSEKDQGAMMNVLDWAFDKVTGNVPGFGSADEMAAKYLKKADNNVTKAADMLVRWQTASAATAGFVTSLGGLPSMVVTLPANIAGVIAIQLRMIGGIAALGGVDFKDEDTKTGMYLCLLGAEAGNVLSKTASQFAVKFTTAALKKLPGEILIKINQAVGFRLFTKFGTTGLVNLGKAIPLLGGAVGGAVDAFSTFGISQAAKTLFLKQAIDSEKNEVIEMARIRLLINMALLDGNYGADEAALIRHIADSSSLSNPTLEKMYSEIECPQSTKVDLSLFKSDDVLSLSLLSGLASLAKVDGSVSPVEKVYLMKIGSELGLDSLVLQQMLD
ncbi:MAG: EcsC family protein [Bacteroidales bacterium]|nr:EcsC family protein [Bacteroidales bacterium]